LFNTALLDSETADTYDAKHAELLQLEAQDAWAPEFKASNWEMEQLEVEAAKIVRAIREYERSVIFGNFVRELETIHDMSVELEGDCCEAANGTVTTQSLSELDRQSIITDVRLRHGVNFDRNLTFRLGGQFLTTKNTVNNDESKLRKIAMNLPKGALLHIHFNSENQPGNLRGLDHGAAHNVPSSEYGDCTNWYRELDRPVTAYADEHLHFMNLGKPPRETRGGDLWPQLHSPHSNESARPKDEATRKYKSLYDESETDLLTEADDHLPPTTIDLVEKYVKACRCTRNKGSHPVNTGPYKCTFGCGHRTKRAFDWRRHEETHEPQGTGTESVLQTVLGLTCLSSLTHSSSVLRPRFPHFNHTALTALIALSWLPTAQAAPPHISTWGLPISNTLAGGSAWAIAAFDDVQTINAVLYWIVYGFWSLTALLVVGFTASAVKKGSRLRFVCAFMLVEGIVLTSLVASSIGNTREMKRHFTAWMPMATILVAGALPVAFKRVVA